MADSSHLELQPHERRASQVQARITVLKSSRTTRGDVGIGAHDDFTERPTFTATRTTRASSSARAQRPAEAAEDTGVAIILRRVGTADLWGQNLNPTSTASCLAEVSPLTARAGSLAGPGFFLPARILSRLFRRLLLEERQAAYEAGRLNFFGEIADFAVPADNRRLAEVRRRECCGCRATGFWRMSGHPAVQ
ncbi:hypothetical protein AJ88_43440 [Mesorhizobium amorphae CCBAU 01583]|nr:hypothetical protein AJ88_43440 [Mesorhizobium amorphae CCBAU 01583]